MFLLWNNGIFVNMYKHSNMQTKADKDLKIWNIHIFREIDKISRLNFILIPPGTEWFPLFLRIECVATRIFHAYFLRMDTRK